MSNAGPPQPTPPPASGPPAPGPSVTQPSPWPGPPPGPPSGPPPGPPSGPPPGQWQAQPGPPPPGPPPPQGPAPAGPAHVPFDVMTVVALLGFASLSFVAMFAVLLSTASLTGREPADLLLMGGVLLLIALCAALLAVAAWAFAHNGSHVGAVVAGGLLAGLGLLATLVGLTERDGGVLVVLGVVETVPGLIVAVLPFSGAATRYRARRRLALALADGAWAALEQERARDLAAWHGPIHLWAARFPGHPAPPHLAQPAPPHLAQPAPPPGQYPPYA